MNYSYYVVIIEVQFKFCLFAIILDHLHIILFYICMQRCKKMEKKAATLVTKIAQLLETMCPTIGHMVKRKK
jgi:hypothetical protein